MVSIGLMNDNKVKTIPEQPSNKDILLVEINLEFDTFRVFYRFK